MDKITETSWPKHKVKSIETRKRDLVIRLSDWTKDRDEPAFDVEVYIAGVYDWNESKVFTTKHAQPPRTRLRARAEAIEFAQAQIEKFLK